MAHQPAIIFSISSQHLFNRAGGRTSNVATKMRRRVIISFAALIAITCVALAILRPPVFISAVGGWKKCAGRYEHVETTGLMDTITLSDGTSVLIQFTSDSDAVAVAALDHIGKGLIFGTSDDDRMVGTSPFRQRITLHGEISNIRTAGYLEGDDFYWFRLSGWSLEAPFDIQVSDDQDFDMAPVIKSCSNLAEAGVRDFTFDGKIIELSKFLISRQ